MIRSRDRYRNFGRRGLKSRIRMCNATIAHARCLQLIRLHVGATTLFLQYIATCCYTEIPKILEKETIIRGEHAINST